MAGKAVDERERQFGQHAHIEVNHLQLLVAISSAGKAHQPEPRIVDDKLRLGAPSGQSLPIRCATPGMRRSAAMTTGRRAPDEAISSASAFNLSTRRAINTNSWPCRAKTRASPKPIPAEAPVMIVIGRGFVIASQSRAPNHHAMTDLPRASALFEKFAWREVARKYRLLDELLRIEGPELADLRIGLDNGIGELSVYARYLANVDVENGRAVFVEPHRTDRTMREADILHRLEEGRRVVGFSSCGF